MPAYPPGVATGHGPAAAAAAKRVKWDTSNTAARRRLPFYRTTVRRFKWSARYRSNLDKSAKDAADEAARVAAAKERADKRKAREEQCRKDQQQAKAALQRLVCPADDDDDSLLFTSRPDSWQKYLEEDILEAAGQIVRLEEHNMALAAQVAALEADDDVTGRELRNIAQKHPQHRMRYTR